MQMQLNNLLNPHLVSKLTTLRELTLTPIDELNVFIHDNAKLPSHSVCEEYRKDS